MTDITPDETSIYDVMPDMMGDVCYHASDDTLCFLRYFASHFGS